jgi:hypothetical protein
VESIEPRVVPATFLVTNLLDSGTGSLRQAILDTNAIALDDLDQIRFDLPASDGPQVIALESELPALRGSVSIVTQWDQPGHDRIGLTPASPDLAEIVGLRVEANACEIAGFTIFGMSHGITLFESAGAHVHDNWIGVGTDGETSYPGTMLHAIRMANASDATIEHNVFTGTERETMWIELPDSSGNAIQYNLLGTTASGNEPGYNGSENIHMGIGAHDNLVAYNVIGAGVTSSNAYGIPAHDNQIIGNVIGLTADLQTTIGSRGAGVYIANSPDNLILSNIICGHTSFGIEVEGELATGTMISGNQIGIAGESPAPNGWHGILIRASDATIEFNTIAYNAVDGISVVGSDEYPVTGVKITHNHIFANGRWAIDLADGGNLEIASPTIVGARRVEFPVGPTFTRVNGTYFGQPYSTYTLEFFVSSFSGATGDGQAASYLGSATIQTDATGRGEYDLTLPSGVADGWTVSATATDEANNTSELAAALPVGDPGAIAAVRVNDGAAQRSKVTAISVAFDRAIDTFATQPDAFRINRLNGGSIVPNVAWTVNGNTSTATLTFATGDLVEYGSLVDGIYTLSIDGAAILDRSGIRVDADGDGASGGVRTNTFHRLFGDIDGDGDNDNSDFLKFRRAMNTSSGDPAYVPGFDFYGDGNIREFDLVEFNRRRGVRFLLS